MRRVVWCTSDFQGWTEGQQPTPSEGGFSKLLNSLEQRWVVRPEHGCLLLFPSGSGPSFWSVSLLIHQDLTAFLPKCSSRPFGCCFSSSVVSSAGCLRASLTRNLMSHLPAFPRAWIIHTMEIDSSEAKPGHYPRFLLGVFQKPHCILRFHLKERVLNII